VALSDIRIATAVNLSALAQPSTEEYIAPVTRMSWVKRAIDLVVALAGLAVLLPVFAVVALAIKLDSAGPIFFGQMRAGKDGQPFRMLKFRSMQQNADSLKAGLQQLNEVSSSTSSAAR
jgi:lipopolysaccharide/colanic/teichoic acid biosynthesis glycosyltransferase